MQEFRHRLNEVDGNELITSVLHDNISLTLSYFNDRMFAMMSMQN